MLLNAFGLPTPAGGETGTAASAVNTWGAIAAGGFGNGAPANGLPKAFINIVLFDQNYKLIDFAYAQVTSSGAPTKIEREYTVKEAGYAYLFISNEHPTQCDVYFDDVKMSFTPSNVVQYNEYYPFGMSTANSWTRENTTGNNFLYNAGTELNSTSNVYDLFYRNYDPVLGRMNQVDPMATSFAGLSPYNYSFNDPVTFNDPIGDCPTCQYQRSDDTWWVANRQSLHGGRYTGFSSLNDFLRENRSSGVFGNTDPWAWTGMSSGDIYGPSFSMYGVGSGQGSISHQEYMNAVDQAKEAGGNLNYHHGRYWIDIPLSRSIFVREEDDEYVTTYTLEYTWAGRESILIEGSSNSNNSRSGSDFLKNASNYMTGIGMAVDVSLWRLGKTLDKRLAYSPRQTGWGQWASKSTPVGPTRVLGINISTSLAKSTATTLKVTGGTLGALGIVMTGTEYFNGNISGTEAAIDTIMGVVGFIGPVGAGISILYFGGKFLYEYTSGNTLFEKPR